MVVYLADRMHLTADLDNDSDFIEPFGRVNDSCIDAMRNQSFRSDVTQDELTRRGRWLHVPAFDFVPYSRPRPNTASDRDSAFSLDTALSSTIRLPGRDRGRWPPHRVRRRVYRSSRADNRYS
jgi:hypothetical protein